MLRKVTRLVSTNITIAEITSEKIKYKIEVLRQLMKATVLIIIIKYAAY